MKLSLFSHNIILTLFHYFFVEINLIKSSKKDSFPLGLANKESGSHDGLCCQMFVCCFCMQTMLERKENILSQPFLFLLSFMFFGFCYPALVTLLHFSSNKAFSFGFVFPLYSLFCCPLMVF